MTRRLRAWGAGAVFAAVLLAGVDGAPAVMAATEDPEPRVSLDRKQVPVDGQVMVAGSGLQAGTLVNAVLCGNAARRGSLDCAVASAVEIGVQQDGTFSAPLRARQPPQPCPCVVMVTGATPEAIVTRVRLRGHPVRSGGRGPRTRTVGRPRVVVRSAELEVGSMVGAWFGAGGEAVLTVALRNEGTVAGTPRLDLGWGPEGSDPDRFIELPQLEPLEPWRTTIVEIPVRFDALANGEQVVAGSVSAGGREVAFDDSVVVRPWGLFAIALVLLLVLPLALLARFVRRGWRRERSEELPAEEVLGVSIFEM